MPATTPRNLARLAAATMTAAGLVNAPVALAHSDAATSYRSLLRESAPAALRGACAMSGGHADPSRLLIQSQEPAAVGASVTAGGARSARALIRFARTLSQTHSIRTGCVVLGPGQSQGAVHSPAALGRGAVRLLVPLALSKSSRTTAVRRVRFAGVAGSDRVTATDPVSGAPVAVRVLSRTTRAMVISLRLTSYPRIVTVIPARSRRPPGQPPARTSTPTTPNPITSPLSIVPFAPTSPWATPLPANVPLDPNSAAIVQNIVHQVHVYYGHAALNSYQYSAPIYTAAATQPTVNMSFNNCQNKSWVDPRFTAALQGVPIPSSAVPSMGSDAEMVVYQPSTDTEWEFWGTVHDPNTGSWAACWGGKITNVSHNLGIFPAGMGATASGLPLLGFLIRASDLQSGSINHALNLEVVDARASSYSWPANRTDGNSSDPTTPAEGERFRLDPNLDLSTLGLSPGGLMIARAMQKYGLIVSDKSGAVAIQGEDERPYEAAHAGQNPYGPYFPGPQYSWLNQIPWQDLQAVAWNYGQPG